MLVKIIDPCTISLGVFDHHSGFEMCQKVVLFNGCSTACATKLHNLSELELSITRYYEVRRLFLQGAHKIEGTKKNLKSHQTKSCEALAWMKTYFHRIGDYLPD